MIDAKCCAFCRHWMLGSTDILSRANALVNGTYCTCHRHQPAEFLGKEICSYFEEIQTDRMEDK